MGYSKTKSDGNNPKSTSQLSIKSAGNALLDSMNRLEPKRLSIKLSWTCDSNFWEISVFKTPEELLILNDLT